MTHITIQRDLLGLCIEAKLVSSPVFLSFQFHENACIMAEIFHCLNNQILTYIH